jgi:hypothetical protein
MISAGGNHFGGGPRVRGKIYLTDEGFGPLVRESAIVEALRALEPRLQLTVQTQAHLAQVPRIIPGTQTVEAFNNISWAKQEDGSPDLAGIADFYADYLPRAADFVARESACLDHDFVLSDFVHEAFPAGAERGVPAFGVCHFTWDWFFSKLYPVPVRTEVLEWLRTCAERATRLYFPPLTPLEILRHYRRVAKEVPFIVRKPAVPGAAAIADDGRFKVLISESGSRVLKNHLQAAAKSFSRLPDFVFYVVDDLCVPADNVIPIARDRLFLDYLPLVELVICRAGFNTISECVANRTPMLLIGETMNPEMEVNMLYLKQAGLATHISLKDFTHRLEKSLPRFIEREYPGVKLALDEHEWPCDGAEVIAADIMETIRS